MVHGSVQRRLAAILSADAVGYTRLMAADEVATLETLNASRDLMGGLVRQHQGRVVDAVGDNLLAEFASAVDAVECALEIQRQLETRNEGIAPDTRMQFRIGINVGDLIVDGERVVGDGVNIAARIQALAEPGGLTLSSSVLDQVQGKVQIEVQDLGEQSLKNVPRPVRVFQVGAARLDVSGDEAARGVSPSVPGFAGRHAIAVLPFQNLSREEDQEYFADGLSEDLITRLSALRRHPIIARNSSFIYKGKTVDVRDVGRQLGVHYVVAGSVRRAGNRVRVSAELVDAEDRRQIWCERYDREISDIFELQDEITEAIMASLGPALSHSEVQHAWRRAPENLDAWDCIHRGLWHLFRYDKAHNAEARSCACRALELEPNSATAYSLLAYSFMTQLVYQWSESPETSLEEARRAAEKAVSLNKNDPNALTALGRVYSLSGQHERAIAVLERATAINPSSALACWALGAALAPAGRPDEAIPMLEKAIRLSPQDPMMHEFLFNIGTAHFVARRFAKAAEFARRSLELKPDQPGNYRVLAASYGHLGRSDAAKAALDGLLRRVPALSEAHLRAFLPPQVVDLYVAGLRKAGWTG